MNSNISCEYVENSGLWWKIDASPLFIDISNENQSVHISIDVSTDDNTNQTKYEHREGFNSNARIDEGHFQFGNCKLIIGTREYNNVNDVPPFGLIEEGWAELYGPAYKTKTAIPFEVARIVIGIANGLSVKDIEGLGAVDVRQMN